MRVVPLPSCSVNLHFTLYNSTIRHCVQRDPDSFILSLSAVRNELLILSFCFWQYYMHLISCEDRKRDGVEIQSTKLLFFINLMQICSQHISWGTICAQVSVWERGQCNVRTFRKRSRALLHSDNKLSNLSRSSLYIFKYVCVAPFIYIHIRFLCKVKGPIYNLG